MPPIQIRVIWSHQATPEEILDYRSVANKTFGCNYVTEDYRNVILDVANTNMDSITEAMLYAASRRQHLVEKVIPYLDKGYVVICDRYLDSSLAYQGYAREIGIDKVYDINMAATDGLLPDLTIYIDLEPSIGLKRINQNNREQNRLDLEKLDFHKKVYEGYNIIAKKYSDRIKVVNGNQTRDEVLNDTIKIINTFLKEKYHNGL